MIARQDVASAALPPCPAETRPRWAHRVITGSPQTDGHSATTRAELEAAASHSPQAQADPGGHWWVLGLCLEDTRLGNSMRTEIFPTTLLYLNQLSLEAHTSHSLRKSY